MLIMFAKLFRWIANCFDPIDSQRHSVCFTISSTEDIPVISFDFEAAIDETKPEKPTDESFIIDPAFPLSVIKLLEVLGSEQEYNDQKEHVKNENIDLNKDIQNIDRKDIDEEKTKERNDRIVELALKDELNNEEQEELKKLTAGNNIIFAGDG